MSLRLDPRIPLVWRTPDTLQIGVDEPVATINGVTTSDERIIAALQAGLPRGTLDVVAALVGGDPAQVDAILTQLGPAILDSDLLAPPRTGDVIVDGSGETADAIAEMLDGLGHTIRRTDGLPHELPDGATERIAPDVVVLVAHHVVRPARYGHWLRRDVPHLAVVFGDTTLSVGPFVQPGSEAPCLCCLDLARQDADPAWQAIATQLAYRAPSAEEPVARLLGAAVAGTAIDRWLRTGESGLAGAAIVIDARTGANSIRMLPPHSQCGCRALTGISTVPGVRADADPPAPSSA